MSKDFDHPCRGSCSGWRQGYEKGGVKAQEQIECLKLALEKCREQRNNMVPNNLMTIPGLKEKHDEEIEAILRKKCVE